MLYMDLLGLYWPQTSSASSVNIILTGPYITYWPRKKSIIDKYCTDVTNYNNTHALYKKRSKFHKISKFFKKFQNDKSFKILIFI